MFGKMTMLASAARCGAGALPATVLATVALAAPAIALPQASTVMEISVGQSHTDSLATGDVRMADGSYLDCYTLRPPQGRAVQIDMQSAQLDPLIIIHGGECGESGSAEIVRDDDSGDGLNARVVRVFSEPVVGIYTTSAPAGQTGAYTISVSLAPQQSSSGNSRNSVGSDAFTNTMTFGQSRQDRLTASDPKLDDNTHVKCYSVTVPTNRTVRVDLESRDFDSYLYVFSGVCGNIGDVIATDDDSGGGLNARIERQFDTADLAIVVNTVGENRTGAFTISVR